MFILYVCAYSMLRMYVVLSAHARVAKYGYLGLVVLQQYVLIRLKTLREKLCH